MSATAILNDSFPYVATPGTATASGTATGGADVTVSATILGGRDTELHNAVSGSTSGLLSLRQTQTAPLWFGPPPFGVSRAALTAENAGGGDLDIDIRVESMRGRPDVPEDGDVVVGDVTGRSTNGSRVDVEVLARGYRIRQEKLDDSSQSSRVMGISNGGDVSVRADFTTGEAVIPRVTTTITDTQIIGQPGPSVSMENAVGGETTGNLELIQRARAGDGTQTDIAFVPSSLPRIPGDGGDASSRLTESGSFTSLMLDSTSRGGKGGAPDRSSAGGDGGAASTLLDGTNDAGGVVVIGNARGGIGGISASEAGAGGDALVDFRATTRGDGQSIRIGSERPDVVNILTIEVTRHGARGGMGGATDRFAAASSPIAGRGGNAVSQSEALAQGDSEVEVYDYARAGSGGPGGNGPSMFSIGGIGARGGDASSRASAIGGGLSRVVANAHAIAGGGSFFVTSGGGAVGDADAFAIAEGLGEVRSSALAEGGGGVFPGSARATSEVAGTVGTATAEARSFRFGARVTRETTTRTRVEAISANGFALPGIGMSSENDGAAFIMGSPFASDIADARGRHAELNSLLVEKPTGRVEALAQWSARGGTGGVETQIVGLDITLETPAPNEELALAVFELDAVGGGFESLLFRLEVHGVVFGEEMLFEDLASANAFFASALVLGQAVLDQTPIYQVPAVRAIFETTMSAGQRVAFGVAAAVVPEPSTALLLGIGLAIAAARRGSAKAR